jgi:restriction system protein
MREAKGPIRFGSNDPEWWRLTPDLTAEEFEQDVMEWLRATGNLLQAFRVSHRERLQGVDGTYEIDIVARFQSLGVEFMVLVECKNHKDPIKREVIQIVYDRIRSTGAHKGIVFSTSPYQKGAIDYAISHGIALFIVSCRELTALAFNTGTGPRMWSWQYIISFSEGEEVHFATCTPRVFRSLMGFVEPRLLLVSGNPP